MIRSFILLFVISITLYSQNYQTLELNRAPESAKLYDFIHSDSHIYTISEGRLNTLTPDCLKFRKFDLNGNIVDTFGEAGTFAYPVPFSFELINSFISSDTITVVLLEEASNTYLYMLKVSSDGSPIQNFGNNGLKLISDIPAGDSFLKTANYGNQYIYTKTSFVADNLLITRILRFDSQGNLDPGFSDENGVQISSTLAENQFNKIMAYVNFIYLSRSIDAGANVEFLRLDNHGNIDSTFGVNGKLTPVVGVPYNVKFYSTIFDENYFTSLIEIIEPDSRNFKVARFDYEGNLVGDYGTGGTVNIGEDGKEYFGHKIVPDNTGGFYVGYLDISSSLRFAEFIRISPSGMLDLTFGYSGFMRIKKEFFSLELINFALINDKLYVQSQSTIYNYINKYSLAGNAVYEFGENGVMTHFFKGGKGFLIGIKKNSDNDLIIGSYATSFTYDIPQFYKINSNFEVDPSYGSTIPDYENGLPLGELFDFVTGEDGKVYTIGEDKSNFFDFKPAYMVLDQSGTHDPDYEFQSSPGELDMLTNIYKFGNDSFIGVSDDFSEKLMCKFNKYGNLDFSFGNSGFSSEFENLVAGQNYFDVETYEQSIYTEFYYDTSRAIAKIGADGNIDNSFGINGIAPYPMHSLSNTISIDENYITIAGYSSFAIKSLSISRMNIDGAVDNSFGTNGNYYITLDYDGDIVNSLYTDNTFFVAGYNLTEGIITIFKFDSSLSPDPDFGEGGKFEITGINDIEENGKIYLEYVNGNLYIGYSPVNNQIDSRIFKISVGPVSVEDEKTTDIPTEFGLNQNYPNPFNPSTKISFSLASASSVKIDVYDILGNRITTLVNGELEQGYHEVNFNAGNLASGMYIYTISATGTDGTNFIDTRKMMLMK